MPRSSLSRPSPDGLPVFASSSRLSHGNKGLAAMEAGVASRLGGLRSCWLNGSLPKQTAPVPELRSVAISRSTGHCSAHGIDQLAEDLWVQMESALHIGWRASHDQCARRCRCSGAAGGGRLWLESG